MSRLLSMQPIMTHPRKEERGRFTLVYYVSFAASDALLRDLRGSSLIADRGRGGIKVIETEGQKLAVRAYRHGGLFRRLTGPFFLNAGRATSEAEIMLYLRERGFPAAAPFAAVIEKLFIFRRLYLITLFEEDAAALLDYLQTCKERERMRVAVRLAELLWGLHQAGVYHRDLHLRNVLVTRENRLILLDFDRAAKKPLTPDDVESMVRRLGRFTGKMEKQGRLSLSVMEKTLFLRRYARLSGCDMTEKMRRGRTARGLLHRVGWFVESLLFGNKK